MGEKAESRERVTAGRWCGPLSRTPLSKTRSRAGLLSGGGRPSWWEEAVPISDSMLKPRPLSLEEMVLPVGSVVVSEMSAAVETGGIDTGAGAETGTGLCGNVMGAPRKLRPSDSLASSAGGSRGTPGRDGGIGDRYG